MSEVETMTLTDFLLARIAEDETMARAAVNPDRPGTHWQWCRYDDDAVVSSPRWEDMPVWLRSVEEFPTTSGVGDLPAFLLNHVEVDEPIALPHIARHDPARVLAECEAKRRIVALHRGKPPWREALPECAECGYRSPCETLRILALPYADHPDHDPTRT